MQSKIAHLATRSVRYLETGEGKPMLLLHAFPLSAEQWLPQLTRPPMGRRLVAPDLRGFGGSDPGVSAGGITLDTYADDLLEFMAHVDMPKAAVVGVSMGGYVALAMVRKAPARITGLVLADTRATADGADARAARDAMIVSVERNGVAEVARQLVPKLLGETTRREQPDLTDAIERLIEVNTAEGVTVAIRAMRDRADATPVLPTIVCSTVVLCGEDDTITPVAECEALARGIPGARFVALAGAGHLSNIERPQAFTDGMMLIS